MRRTLPPAACVTVTLDHDRRRHKEHTPAAVGKHANALPPSPSELGSQPFASPPTAPQTSACLRQPGIAGKDGEIQRKKGLRCKAA